MAEAWGSPPSVVLRENAIWGARWIARGEIVAAKNGNVADDASDGSAAGDDWVTVIPPKG